MEKYPRLRGLIEQSIKAGARTAARMPVGGHMHRAMRMAMAGMGARVAFCTIFS